MGMYQKKTTEWEDIIENCGMDTESESESEPEVEHKTHQL